MKGKKRGELILGLFFLAFFVIMLSISMTYSPNARRMPLVVGIPGLLLAAAVAWKAATAKERVSEAGEAESGESQKGKAGAEPLQTTGERKSLPAMIGWVAILVAMIWIFGFLTTIPVYTVLFMKGMKESWRASFIMAGAGFAVLYLLFVVLLNIELYPGLLFRRY